MRIMASCGKDLCLETRRESRMTLLGIEERWRLGKGEGVRKVQEGC